MDPSTEYKEWMYPDRMEVQGIHNPAPKLGTGERFNRLAGKLERKGARDPKALAAWIGRRKYGKKRFQEFSAAGRRRK